MNFRHIEEVESINVEEEGICSMTMLTLNLLTKTSIHSLQNMHIHSFIAETFIKQLLFTMQSVRSLR